MVNNIGEGAGFLQSQYSGPIGEAIDNVWTGQTNSIIDGLNSSGAASSSSSAAGGFLIYPNMSNNNAPQTVYRK